MGLSPILPIAGATLGSLAGKALDSLTGGPSFLETFQAAMEIGRSKEGEDDLTGEEAPSVEDLAKEVEQLVQRLRKLLAEARADPSFPIELTSDGRDGVILDSPHPDRVAIEHLLAQDPQLRSEFHQLAAEIAAAHRSQVPFGLSHEAADFRLRVDASGAEVIF